MITLEYEDVVELLGYIKGDRVPLEILGYKHSPEGMANWLEEQPNIVPLLVLTITKDLEEYGIFPSAFRVSNHEAYVVYIEKLGSTYVLIDIDKPSNCVKELFQKPEDAARALIVRRLDGAWIRSGHSAGVSGQR